MPEDCRTREDHAPLVESAEVRSILKRERAALNRVNDRLIRCTEHAEKNFVINPVPEQE